MPARFIVRRPEQVTALAGPLPQRMIAAMERLGPATVGEIAAVIDVEPETLYYHVRRLLRVGLLRECGGRQSGRHVETLYALPGRELVLDHRTTTPAFLRALAKATASLLRLVDRQASAALHSARTRRAGRWRNFMVQQHFARLPPAALAELNERLEAIAAFVAAHDDPDRDDWVSLTMVMTPLQQRQ